jgi:hypothetical protein
LVKFEHFLGFYKLSILVFAQANKIAALQFSHDIYSSYISHCHTRSAALTNQNIGLRFCIQSISVLLQSLVPYLSTRSRPLSIAKIRHFVGYYYLINQL